MVKTKSGRILSAADIDGLAERTEEGLDLSAWTPRRGRPSLDAEAGSHSPRIAVRLPGALYERVRVRAANEHRSVSEVVRELLETYAPVPRIDDPSPLSSVDRSEIRRAIAMTDVEREAYYLGSNQNMLRMFDEARRSR